MGSPPLSPKQMAITPVQFDLAPGFSEADFANALSDALQASGVAAADIKVETGASNGAGCTWKHTFNGGVGTYSSTYSRFMMLSGSIYFVRYNDFDIASGSINGTQYLDYAVNTYNSTSGAFLLTYYSNVSNAFFRVWTSAIDTDFSVIEFHNGSNEFTFWSIPNSATFNSWVNFDQRTINPVYFPCFYYSGYWMRFNAIQNMFHRRDVQMGSGGGWTSTFYQSYNYHSQYQFILPSNYKGTTSSAFPYQSMDRPWTNNNNCYCHTTIPTANDYQVPSLGTDKYQPMIKGMPYSGYTSHTLPEDFGVVPIGTNGLSAGDKFVVQSGIEEYEAITVRNNNGSDSYTSGAFVARII